MYFYDLCYIIDFIYFMYNTIWRETSNGRLVSVDSGGFQPHSTKAPFI